MKRALAMVVAFVAAGCGTSSSGSGKTGNGAPCETDLACGTGQVCLNKKCGVVECTTVADCGVEQVCIADPGGSDAKVCTGVQCSTSDDCTGGAECVSGICEGGTSIGGCGPSNPCPSGQSCNTTTGQCEGGEAPGPGVCTTCTADAACGAGASCVTLGNGKFCALDCTTNADCESGFTCIEAGGGGKVCAPGKFECGGCLTGDACADGQHCNPDTGACVDDAEQCAVCTTDGECGAGMRCVGKGATRYCVPECADGSCPANGTCEDLDGGVKACKWQTDGPCCLGSNCQTADPCAACGGDKPQCKDGTTCVECLSDLDCSNKAPKTKCTANACVLPDEVPPTCEAPTPYWNSAKQECCECTTSAHCGGKACDPTTCTCKTGGGTGGVCDTCVDPYPACTEYPPGSGSQVCVQCTGPEHCASGQCNTASFTCEGDVIVSGDCETKGCNDPALACDSQTGLCYAPDGNCDNVTQFCINGGKCVSILETFGALFGGGSGGGLPSLPGAPEGGGLPGNCECTGGDPLGLSQGNCPDGLVCSKGILGLFELMAPGQFSAPSTCQKSQLPF